MNWQSLRAWERLCSINDPGSEGVGIFLKCKYISTFNHSGRWERRELGIISEYLQHIVHNGFLFQYAFFLVRFKGNTNCSQHSGRFYWIFIEDIVQSTDNPWEPKSISAAFVILVVGNFKNQKNVYLHLIILWEHLFLVFHRLDSRNRLCCWPKKRVPFPCANNFLTI